MRTSLKVGAILAALMLSAVPAMAIADKPGEKGTPFSRCVKGGERMLG